MTKIIAGLKKVVAHAVGLFPHKLPLTESEFKVFAEKICDTYDIPKMDSYFHAIAAMIQHLPPTEHKSSLSFFGKSIKKAMSNEVAFNIMADIKSKAKAAAEEAKKIAEEAEKATLSVVSDEAKA